MQNTSINTKAVLVRTNKTQDQILLITKYHFKDRVSKSM